MTEKTEDQYVSLNRLLNKLKADEFTGKLILNFHKGFLSIKAEARKSIILKEVGGK